MKSPEAAIRNVLIADDDARALFEERIYPVIAPMSATYPFVIYKRTGIQRESTINGPMGTPTVNLDITVIDATYEAARQAADTIRSILDQYAGFVGGVYLQQVAVQNEADDFVQLGGSEMPPSYSVTLSLDVLWMETER
jgi:hypothetical protein